LGGLCALADELFVLLLSEFGQVMVGAAGRAGWVGGRGPLGLLGTGLLPGRPSQELDFGDLLLGAQRRRPALAHHSLWRRWGVGLAFGQQVPEQAGELAGADDGFAVLASWPRARR